MFIHDNHLLPLSDMRSWHWHSTGCGSEDWVLARLHRDIALFWSLPSPSLAHCLYLSPIVSTCIPFLYFSSSRYVAFALVDIFLNYLLSERTLVDPRAVVPTAAPDLCWRLFDRRMEISRPHRSLMTTRDAPYGFFLFSHLLFESPKKKNFQ